MKQELRQILRELITEFEFHRFVCVGTIQELWMDADKKSTTTKSTDAFYNLNCEKNELRKLDKKLKKLRQLQKSLITVDAFICNGEIFDSQMNIVERRWKP